MLFFCVDGDVFADQRAGPVVEGHVAADAGAFEADVPRAAQGPVDVVVAGDQSSIFPPFPAVQNALGKKEVFHRRGGRAFGQDVLVRDALGEEVALHGFRFRDGLVRSLSAGGNQPGRGRVLPVHLDGLVQPVAQELGHPAAVQQARAVNDDVVKILFPWDDLQKQRVDHEDQERHGAVDDRHAEHRQRNGEKGFWNQEGLYFIGGDHAHDAGDKDRLPGQDDQPEQQGEQLGQAPSFPFHHHDPVVDQEKGDDQDAQQDRVNDKQNGDAPGGAKEVDHQRKQGKNRQEQGVAVSVPAAVFVKQVRKQGPAGERKPGGQEDGPHQQSSFIKVNLCPRSG